MDIIQKSVKLVVDLGSLTVMQFVGDKMGVMIDISAKAGQRYSSRGGEGTSVVPKGYCHVVVNPPADKMKEFWEKVSQEKTKRRLILEASLLQS